MPENLKDFIKPGTEEDLLVKQLDFSRLPRHVAVIMDGNGRWAKKRKLPRVAGHREPNLSAKWWKRVLIWESNT